MKIIRFIPAGPYSPMDNISRNSPIYTEVSATICISKFDFSVAIGETFEIIGDRQISASHGYPFPG